MNLFEKEALVNQKAVELESASPEAILQYAVETFPNITFACSFGAEDVVLVDMLQKISPKTDIFYLDTDFHFKETYETRDNMEEIYGLKFVQVKPKQLHQRNRLSNSDLSFGKAMLTNAAESAKLIRLRKYCLNMKHGLPVFVAIKPRHVQIRKKSNMILNSDLLNSIQ